MADISWLTLIAGGGGTFFIGLLSFWMALASKIEGSNNKAKAAAERAERAEVAAHMAMAKQDLLAREVSEFRVETGAHCGLAGNDRRNGTLATSGRDASRQKYRGRR
jgi:hypothetical protein